MIRYATISTLLLCSMMLASCLYGDDEGFRPDFPVGQIQGYKPIYMAREDLAQVGLQPPRPISAVGQMHGAGPLLLVVSPGRGIHVFDNTIPATPNNIGFLAVPAIVDLATRGQTLFVPQLGDLLVFDMADPGNIPAPRRISNAFVNRADQVSIPPEQITDDLVTYFECENPEEGVLVGWELDTLNNPLCYLRQR